MNYVMLAGPHWYSWIIVIIVLGVAVGLFFLKGKLEDKKDMDE